MSARWTVPEDGLRLDLALCAQLDCSRSRARELLERGAVQVDGRVVRDKGRRLVSGQEVAVTAAPAALDRLQPVQAPLAVLAEGTGWVCVDKPAGLPVHPLRHDEADSLLQRVAARYPRIEGIGEGGLRSGVVHRLDVDTSGAQLFALDAANFESLREAFRQHRIEKVYRAVVRGVPAEYGALELDLEITRHRPARVTAAAAGTGGPRSRRCPLRWLRREAFESAALVELWPSTGFLHQIRVSCAWLGHPLLGDAVYGDGSGAPRQMLHASRLSLGEIEARSPDPPDFARLLELLRC